MGLRIIQFVSPARHGEIPDHLPMRVHLWVGLLMLAFGFGAGYLFGRYQVKHEVREVVLPAVAPSAEEICRENLRRLRGKVDGESLELAYRQIVKHGREIGFEKVLLEKIESEGFNHRHIEVLGRMLEKDTIIRQGYSRGTGSRLLDVPLSQAGRDVVPGLIREAEKAEGSELEKFVLALARAHVSEAEPLFLKLLNEHSPRAPYASITFYAAVGLAQLGNSEGFKWLADHSHDRHQVRFSPQPNYSNMRTLGSDCSVILQ